MPTWICCSTPVAPSRRQPSLLSTIKLRRAGFDACMDSEDMIVEWLLWLQKRCILPAR